MKIKSHDASPDPSAIFREAGDEDLKVQCDAFEEALMEDEEMMKRLFMDTNRHQQVFSSLWAKVMFTCAKAASPANNEGQCVFLTQSSKCWQNMVMMIKRHQEKQPSLVKNQHLEESS